MRLSGFNDCFDVGGRSFRRAACVKLRNVYVGGGRVFTCVVYNKDRATATETSVKQNFFASMSLHRKSSKPDRKTIHV